MRIISIIFFFIFSFILLNGCGEDFGDGYTGVDGAEGVEESVSIICEEVRNGWDAHSYGVEVDLEGLWNEWEQNSCEEREECEDRVDKRTEKTLGDCGESFTCIDLAHFESARGKEACWED